MLTQITLKSGAQIEFETEKWEKWEKKKDFQGDLKGVSWKTPDTFIKSLDYSDSMK